MITVRPTATSTGANTTANAPSARTTTSVNSDVLDGSTAFCYIYRHVESQPQPTQARYSVGIPLLDLRVRARVPRRRGLPRIPDGRAVPRWRVLREVPEGDDALPGEGASVVLLPVLRAPGPPDGRHDLSGLGHVAAPVVLRHLPDGEHSLRHLREADGARAWRHLQDGVAHVQADSLAAHAGGCRDGRRGQDRGSRRSVHRWPLEVAEPRTPEGTRRRMGRQGSGAWIRGARNRRPQGEDRGVRHARGTGQDVHGAGH